MSVSAIKIGEVPAWLGAKGPDGDVVVSTRLRLARNLSNHRFPVAASQHERKDVFEEVLGALKRIESFHNFTSYNFRRLPRLDQQLLVEERVASPDLLGIEGERGVVSDSAHRINIMINEEDHLRMQCIDSGCGPESMFDLLDAIDTTMGEKLSFAYDTRRGFLTSCPTNAGTGMRVSYLVHLPGLVLTKTADQVLQAAAQMGVCTRGFFGEHAGIVGAFFQLSNQAALGIGEKEFIKQTRSAIRTIAGCERESREKIMHNAKTELEDKVWRAYGIIAYATTLSVGEFLNLSSALRLGIEVGIFEKLTVRRLNRIMLLVLPAHMQAYVGRTMNDDDINRERADLVRTLFKE